MSRFFTFNLRDEIGAACALNVRHVDSVVPMVALTRVPEAAPGVLGLVNIHGCLLPVLDLSPWFGLPAREPGVADFIVIVRGPRGRFGIAVAAAGDVRPIDPETPTAGDTLLPGLDRRVDGVMALPDGTLLLWDVAKFLASGGDELLASIPVAAQ